MGAHARYFSAGYSTAIRTCICMRDVHRQAGSGTCPPRTGLPRHRRSHTNREINGDQR